MTQLWNKVDGAGIENSTGWILVNPSTGSNTLAVSYTGSPDTMIGFAQPWYGVSQTGGSGGSWRSSPPNANDGGSGSGTASVTVSNAVSGDMVLDVAAIYDTVGGGGDLTANGSQTVQNQQNRPASQAISYGTSNKLATGSTAMTWTLTSSFWAQGAVSLIPASSGSGTGDTGGGDGGGGQQGGGGGGGGGSASP